MSPGVRQFASVGDTLHVVQITDTHLKRDAGGKLLGMDTDFSLQQVLELVQRERDNVDLVLGTGDISDHGSEAAYVRAGDYFATLEAEVAWLVGNHDDGAAMARVLGGPDGLNRVLESRHWLIVMLNSQIPGEVGGELGADELMFLQSCLEYARDKPLHCLVCLHHQPVPIGSAWIDEQMVADHEAFFEMLDHFECARAVLWGHVHQEVDIWRAGKRLLATPSSCVQFAPGSVNFKADDQPPGYRWLNLAADGSIDTGVSRVQGVHFTVDLDSRGYL